MSDDLPGDAPRIFSDSFVDGGACGASSGWSSGAWSSGACGASSGAWWSGAWSTGATVKPFVPYEWVYAYRDECE